MIVETTLINEFLDPFPTKQTKGSKLPWRRGDEGEKMLKISDAAKDAIISLKNKKENA